MKVLYSGTLAATAGGPAMSIYLTMYGLRLQNVNAEIMQYPLTEGDVLRGEEVPVHYAKPPIEHKFGYSPSLRKAIRALGTYDIYHAQGVWQYNTYALVDEARRANIPYLITPRGMLYPQDIAKSNTVFKRLSLKCRLLDDLNGAACVHVTCVDELKHCCNLGVTAPIAIIPNPVEIKEYSDKKQDDVFRIGYIGRVSRRKNIHGLIQAYMDLEEEMKGTELLIIGGGDDTYMKELTEMAKKVKYGTVCFAGFLNGKEKDEALASCSVLVMPSEFENLGNVILEGLVRGIPCIATTGAPWSELNTEHCGWQVPYTQKDITEAIYQARHTSVEELTVMGMNGRRLMERRYSVESVAARMKQLYSWILNKEDKPDFVHTLLPEVNGGKW